jgi:hypothetical protein
MRYVTVFDLTQKPFQWWFPAVGTAVIAMGIVLILINRRWPSQTRAKSTGWVAIVFGSLWTFAVFIGTFTQYRRCLVAFRTGHYQTAEGNVENFRPMPYEGHTDECFIVQGTTFCYSDYGIQPGFNSSTSHGGPIRSGLPVRVSYYDGQILRLEIGSDAVDSSTTSR